MINQSLSEQAFNNELLNKIIFDYTLSILSKTFDSLVPVKVADEELKKCVWLVSILSDSENNIHKRKAQLFTSLLYLNNKENIEILKICYILFSRIGNLTATKFLEGLYEQKEINPANLKSKYEFGDLITEELIYERGLRMISPNQNQFLITNFQKELWDSLDINSEISISAPTSSGKSFIIKQHLIKTFLLEKTFRVLYIVPSRALINQVSEDFISEINSDTHIKTSFVAESEVFEKEIYVLTPERCIKVLSSNLEIDLIFIDEIQGIEDIGGRGQTFEYVFNEITILYPNAKIISAGPNILNPDKTFYEIFQRESSTVLTKLSPVFQIKLTLKNIEKGLFDITVQNEEKKYQNFTHNFNVDFSKINTLGEKMAFLINTMAPNDFNIVYVSDGDLAQKWARKYADIKEEEAVLNDEVKELIDFLKEDIHKKYFLIECLQKGIAYHHGSLPDIVRKEIEVLYINENIKTLFCTSTLLEGVNLPANNLFTFQPKKDSTPLTKFEFGNLIGRAGRLNSSLYGTIYYLEKSEDKIKATEYFDVEYEKEIEIFSTKAFLDFEIDDLKKPIKEIAKINKSETSKTQQMCVFLRHKYLKDSLLVEKYLMNKNYSESEIKVVLDILEESLSEIQIPLEILKKKSKY